MAKKTKEELLKKQIESLKNELESERTDTKYYQGKFEGATREETKQLNELSISSRVLESEVIWFRHFFERLFTEEPRTLVPDHYDNTERNSRRCDCRCR